MALLCVGMAFVSSVLYLMGVLGCRLGGRARGLKPPSQFLRFILCNNIAAHCIFRGEYPNICIYSYSLNIPAPVYSYKLVYAPGVIVPRGKPKKVHHYPGDGANAILLLVQ